MNDDSASRHIVVVYVLHDSSLKGPGRSEDYDSKVHRESMFIITIKKYLEPKTQKKTNVVYNNNQSSFFKHRLHTHTHTHTLSTQPKMMDTNDVHCSC